MRVPTFGEAAAQRLYPIWRGLIKALSRQGAKAEADVREVPVRSKDIGDPEFHHDRHRRKIGKRYFGLVRELLSQADRSRKSGAGDFLDVDKGRPHDVCREMPGILEWPALE